MTELLWILAYNLIRYVIIFGGAYLFFWRLFPKPFQHLKIQLKERQKPQIFLELKYSLFTILIQSAVMWSLYLGVQKGFFDIYSGFGTKGYLQEAVAVVVYFIFYDAYFYFSHKLLHQDWFYKRVHVIHHMSLNPTPFASYSFHPLEAVISLLYLYPILYFFPMSLQTLLVLGILTDFGNLAGHLGYDLVPEFIWKSRAAGLLTTPTHHNMHHQYSRSNFGLYWRGWDQIFKTLHPRTQEEFLRVKSQKANAPSSS